MLYRKVSNTSPHAYAGLVVATHRYALTLTPCHIGDRSLSLHYTQRVYVSLDTKVYSNQTLLSLAYICTCLLRVRIMCVSTACLLQIYV